MDRTGKLIGKNFVDDPVTINPPFAFEAIRHNIDTEVGFSFRLVPGMSRVKMRLIDHFQMGR